MEFLELGFKNEVVGNGSDHNVKLGGKLVD